MMIRNSVAGGNGMKLQDEMSRLVTAIEHEIDAVEGDMGNLGDDIAEGLCQRFADEWNLFDGEGKYPDWLRWIVVGALKKQGITTVPPELDELQYEVGQKASSDMK
jgi:hypothetical protein